MKAKNDLKSQFVLLLLAVLVFCVGMLFSCKPKASLEMPNATSNYDVTVVLDTTITVDEYTIISPDSIVGPFGEIYTKDGEKFYEIVDELNLVPKLLSSYLLSSGMTRKEVLDFWLEKEYQR